MLTLIHTTVLLTCAESTGQVTEEGASKEQLDGKEGGRNEMNLLAIITGGDGCDERGRRPSQAGFGMLVNGVVGLQLAEGKAA